MRKKSFEKRGLVFGNFCFVFENIFPSKYEYCKLTNTKSGINLPDFVSLPPLLTLLSPLLFHAMALTKLPWNSSLGLKLCILCTYLFKKKPQIDMVVKAHSIYFLNRMYYFCLIQSIYIPLHHAPHSSEIRRLCSMKCSSETLQNLPYF